MMFSTMPASYRRAPLQGTGKGIGGLRASCRLLRLLTALAVAGSTALPAQPVPPPDGSRRSSESTPALSHPRVDLGAIIVGSGGPPYNPNRSGPSAAIRYGNRFVLVDMGNGTLARLWEAGISLTQFDAFLFTHHHRDHDEEFLPLLNTALVRGVRLDIVGPPGTAQLSDFALTFYAEDLAYRLERMGRGPGDFPRPNVRDIHGGETFWLGKLEVKTARVPHSLHTVAYRFEVEGRSIVVSGDLTYSDELIELARDTDVLILDGGGAAVHQGAPRPGSGPPSGRGQKRPAHSNLREVRRMAQGSRARKLVLTHIGPGEIDERATIEAIREVDEGKVYAGEVIVGRDLLEIAPSAP